MKKRYFIDMDGTLNEWNFGLPYYEMLYEEGYFRNRPPHQNVVDAVKMLISEGEDVYILSAVLQDSDYALFEKHEWLDEHLPIECKRRIFSICGEDKIGAVPAFNKDTDILVDDYGVNCKTWAEAGGKFVKVSVDADDWVAESSRYSHSIHPYMDPQRIINLIKEV